MARGRIRPKDINSKGDMLAYLEGNLEYEYPFVEEAWQKAEQIYAEDKDKKKSIGSIYFQLMGLAQYRKLGNELRNKEFKKMRIIEEEEIIDSLLGDDEEESEFIKELISIYFSNIKDPEDLKFVIERMSDYYSNYEFNEGSDKFLVVSAVADELALRELYAQRVLGQDNEKRVKDVKEGYLKTLASLKVLKSDKKIDSTKNKFTALVDELSRTGELNIDSPEYPKDEIDYLIEAMRRSVERAYNGT